MSELRFRKENEVKIRYSTRVTRGEWSAHEANIRFLHGEKKTKADILEALILDDFYPSMPQLSTQMKKWGLRVYGQRRKALPEAKKAESVASTPETVISGQHEPVSSFQDGFDCDVAADTSGNSQETQQIIPAPSCMSLLTESHTIDPPPQPTSTATHVIDDNVPMLDTASDTSSMRTFLSLANRLRAKVNASSVSVSKGTDAMSVDSRDSYSFRQVTGMTFMNSSTELVRASESSSDLSGRTSHDDTALEDLQRLHVSPLLPLHPSSVARRPTQTKVSAFRETSRNIKTGASLPPIACWWPLSPPKYEDEFRFSSAYELLFIFKSCLSIVTAFETNRHGVLKPAQAFHDFHDSLLLGIGCLSESLCRLLSTDDECTEDRKLRGDLRFVTVFAKLTLVSDLIDVWQSPPENGVDVTNHMMALTRAREEGLRALMDFQYRMEQAKLAAVTNGIYGGIRQGLKSFL